MLREDSSEVHIDFFLARFHCYYFTFVPRLPRKLSIMLDSNNMISGFATRLATWLFKFFPPASKHESIGSPNSAPATKNGTGGSQNIAPATKMKQEGG